MKKQLDISTTLSLPPDVVTQRDAILAVSGAGKSNAARAMAEEFFAAQLPFVAIDPKGDWWGLRSGREGTAKGGLDVVIFGGSRADVPLERTGGAYVAELIAKERLSSILDLSAFESKAAMKAFLHDFGQRLYRKNQDPLKLFCDEADEYLPQKPQKDELRLLSVYEDIVRRGRTKGLGITIITQRSAIVSKNVLTQVETLYAMRTTGPQDVKVIEAWMQYHGADRAMLSTLATLADGEAWVWSPHYLKKMARFRFRLSHTFDSGATPTNHRTGSRRRAATLSDVDVGAIAAKMKETIERAAAEDPRVLQQRVRELEKELSKQQTANSKQQGSGSGSGAVGCELSASDLLPWRQWVGRLRAELEVEQQRSDEALRRVEELETHLAQLHLGLDQLDRWRAGRPKNSWAPLRVTSGDLERRAAEKMPGEVANGRLAAAAQGAAAKEAPVTGPRSPGTGLNGKHPASAATRPEEAPRTAMTVLNGKAPHRTPDPGPRSPESIKPGELRILGALAARGPLSRTRLALLTGYQHTAGGFATTMASMKSRGWIETAELGVALTPEGKAQAKDAPAPPQGEELTQLWVRKLSGAGVRLFSVLREAKGPMTAQQVAEAAGYKSAAAGNIAEALSELRRYALIEGSNKALSLGEAKEDFV